MSRKGIGSNEYTMYFKQIIGIERKIFATAVAVCCVLLALMRQIRFNVPAHFGCHLVAHRGRGNGAAKRSRNQADKRFEHGT